MAIIKSSPYYLLSGKTKHEQQTEVKEKEDSLYSLCPTLQEYRHHGSMWRLVFSKKKLAQHQRKQLAEVLEDIDYTCGFMFGIWITFYCYHLHIKIPVLPNILMFLQGFSR